MKEEKKRWLIIGASAGGTFSGVGYVITTPPEKWNLRDASICVGSGALGGALVSDYPASALAGGACGLGLYLTFVPRKDWKWEGAIVSTVFGGFASVGATYLSKKFA